MRFKEVNYLFKGMQLESSEAEIVTHNSTIPKPLAFFQIRCKFKRRGVEAEVGPHESCSMSVTCYGVVSYHFLPSPDKEDG